MAIDVVFPAEEEDIIDQSEKVKEETGKHMSQMGWIFDRVHDKLGKDSTCFKCKKEIKAGEQLQLLQATNSPEGSVTFVSICDDCFKELEKTENKEETETKEEENKTE